MHQRVSMDQVKSELSIQAGIGLVLPHILRLGAGDAPLGTRGAEREPLDNGAPSLTLIRELITDY